LQKKRRFLWVLILLIAIAWMAAGSLLTSDAIDSGSVGADVSNEIKALASELDLELAPDFPLPLVFVFSGLPIALIALFFVWRNQRAIGGKTSISYEKALRRQSILITILALVFALFLWNMPDVEQLVRQEDGTIVSQGSAVNASIITYPVRLFVTFVHEASHALAALLSGGRVEGFTVSPNGSGMARVAGGNIALIAPAGYLGAALFGAMLFFVTSRKPQWTRSLSVAIGVAIVALTLSFATPDAQQNLTALAVGIGFGVGLIALGAFAPRAVTVFLLNTLAILTGLNAVFDLWHVVRNANPAPGGPVNDAANFSAQVTPLLPPAVVAFMWAAIAVGMMSAAIYYGLIRQVRGEIDQAVQG